MLRQASFLPSEQSYRVKDAEKTPDYMGLSKSPGEKRKTLTLYQNKRLNMVAGEIFIHYTDERFPFLLGRKGTFDAKGAYLSVI